MSSPRPVTIDDFFAPADPLATADSTPPTTLARDFLRDKILEELSDELAHFDGLPSLRRLFWEQLGYERVDARLPEEFWLFRFFGGWFSQFWQHAGEDFEPQVLLVAEAIGTPL